MIDQPSKISHIYKMQSSENKRQVIYRFLQSKTFGLLAFLACGLLLFVFTLLKIRDGLYFDDTFMFVRYAQNIIQYGNYGWNPHEHTYGCTNIPFTYFVVLLKTLRIDQLLGLSATLLLSSFFWALCSLALLYKIMNDLMGDRLGTHRWLLILYTATLAIAPVFAYNIITGMDTTFSLFFNVLMIHFLFRYLRRSGPINLFLAAWFSYFIFLLRPDCGIYSVFLPVLFFMDQKLQAKKIFSFYILLFLFFAVDTGIKYVYFGNPLPLPFYVKKGGFYLGYLSMSYWNTVQYSFDFLIDFGFLFIAFLLFCSRRAMKKFLVFGIPLFLSIVYYFTVTQIMGFHSRYYLPSMPFFVIGTIYGFSEMKTISMDYRKLVLPLVYCIFILFLQFAAPVYEIYVQEKSRMESAAFTMPVLTENRLHCKALGYKEGIAMMEKLLQLLPPDATVAATEYGYLSVKVPGLKFLDLCGLHNADMALHGYNDRFLKDWNPVLIWMPPGDYTSLRYAIATGAYFREHYDYYPDAVNYGVAILKNSPGHDLLVKMIHSVCK
jgi:hypothetical protein